MNTVCPRCGKEIMDSEGMKFCPYCKKRLNKNDNNKLLFPIIIIIILLGIIAWLLWDKYMGTPVQELQQQVIEETEQSETSEYQGSLDDIANSVVTVYCYNERGDLSANGSGFIAFDDKTLVTNYHVLSEGCKVEIETLSGERYTVETILKANRTMDLVIASLDKDTGLDPVSFGDDQTAKQGDKIYTLGSPMGLANTLSDGLISGKAVMADMNNMEVFQISAPISPGSSGGPVINSEYEVIGISFAGYEEGQNLNFAIPISELFAMKEKSYMGSKTTETMFRANHLRDITQREALDKVNNGEYFTLDELRNSIDDIREDEDIAVMCYFSSAVVDKPLLTGYAFDSLDLVTGDFDKDEFCCGDQSEERKHAIFLLSFSYLYDISELEPGDLVIVYGTLSDFEDPKYSMVIEVKDIIPLDK